MASVLRVEGRDGAEKKPPGRYRRGGFEKDAGSVDQFEVEPS